MNYLPIAIRLKNVFLFYCKIDVQIQPPFALMPKIYIYSIYLSFGGYLAEIFLLLFASLEIV